MQGPCFRSDVALTSAFDPKQPPSRGRPDFNPHVPDRQDYTPIAANLAAGAATCRNIFSLLKRVGIDCVYHLRPDRSSKQSCSTGPPSAHPSGLATSTSRWTVPDLPVRHPCGIDQGVCRMLETRAPRPGKRFSRKSPPPRKWSEVQDVPGDHEPIGAWWTVLHSGATACKGPARFRLAGQPRRVRHRRKRAVPAPKCTRLPGRRG